MTRCNEISPMLGAFEDGELEPHEMQEIARHLAQCAVCEGELALNSALGRYLRSTAVEPDLAGFSQTVEKRLARLAPPIHVRVRRYFESTRERMVGALALTSAALATAALTVVLFGPYASQYASRLGSRGPQTSPAVTAENQANTEFAAGVADSRTVISRLETYEPSVAVWSEPITQTTVIWIPDDQP